MKYLLTVILIQPILLVVLSSTNRVNDSALATTGVGFSPCVKGERFYSRGRCRRCPSCKKKACVKGERFYSRGRCRKCPSCKKKAKATNYMSYNLKFSEEYGALECYPCYCKLGKKAFDTHSKRCVKCPPCDINGKLNINANITVDEWHGAMSCFPCICNTGYFGNALTHYQCVDCIKCQKQNREEIVPCTPDRDAQCGDCLDGYRKVNDVACVKVKTTTKESVNQFISDMSTTDPSTTTKAPQKTSHVDHVSTTQKSHIIINVILVIVVFIAGAMLCICYRIFKKPPCRIPYNVSRTTSAATMSSKNSVDKIEDEKKTENHPSATSLLINGSSDIEHDTDNGNTESNGAECAFENKHPELSNNEQIVYINQYYQYGNYNRMITSNSLDQNNLPDQIV